MIDLYDDEILKVHKIVEDLSTKYSGKTATGEVLNNLQREAVGRLLDIGLVATVDVTPCIVGKPPVIAIDSRVDMGEFDHDRKRWEVEQSRKKGGN
jgi:hypothetical protein